MAYVEHKHRFLQQGVTLIELVMVTVIVSILTAVAVPKFYELAKTARVTTVNAFAENLRSVADIWHMKCAVTAGCDIKAGSSYLSTLDGASIRIWRGYPDGGELDADIDKALIYSGFTLSTTGNFSLFTRDGAPTPAQCSVQYTEPQIDGAMPTLTVLTSGC